MNFFFSSPIVKKEMRWFSAIVVTSVFIKPATESLRSLAVRGYAGLALLASDPSAFSVPTEEVP